MNSHDKPTLQSKRGTTPPVILHHYVLIHVALRQIFFSNPLDFFLLIVTGQADKYLKDIWRQVCERCDETGRPSFDISDVQFIKESIDNYPLLLVKMPPPHAINETHYAAMFIKLDLEAEEQPDNPDVRFFTLEVGASLDGPERAVFCEWTENEHRNYGAIPSATKEDFIKAIRQMV